MILMRYAIFIFGFLILLSCAKNYDQYGKLSFHSATNKNIFVFSVDDKFYQEFANSQPHDEHPRLNNNEFKLLKSLLKTKNYCLNSNSNPEFEIISRQEKIYDATFSKLIADNYNARPLTPVSYYGRCLNNN